MIYIGVDPGASGYVAAVGEDGAALWAQPIPMIGKDVDVRESWIMLQRQRHDIRMAAIEVQQAFPSQGACSAFRLACNYTAILTVIQLTCPVDRVRPAAWKRAMGVIVPSGTPQDQRSRRAKGLSVAKASDLFPGFDLRVSDRGRKPSPDKAEALLLAEYARRSAHLQSGGPI